MIERKFQTIIHSLKEQIRIKEYKRIKSGRREKVMGGGIPFLEGGRKGEG